MYHKTIGTWLRRCCAGLLASILLLAAIPCVNAAQTATAGFQNGSADLDLTEIARYDAGMTNADGGVMEIVDYNSVTGWAYAVNGQSGCLTAIKLDAQSQDDQINALAGRDLDLKALVPGFAYGDMTSVAVSPDGSTLAVALQAEAYTANGCVALFTCNADGSLTFRQAVEVGVQPDMVTFTPDGARILTANEGEPREGYAAVDPMGSVSIITAATGEVTTVDFTCYDTVEARQALVDAGIVLKSDAAPSADLEPEYIAATNDTAYVSLQEANAIAVLDLNSGSFTGVYSVGVEDYSVIPVDIDKKDECYSPSTYDSLRGLRMPDGISLYQVNGETYLLTANEGDSRDWTDYCNEDERNFGKNKTSPTGAITAENSGLEGKVVFCDSSDYDGLDSSKDYLFGGRSFTLFRVTESGLEEVFDSGKDFEEKTAAYLGDYFNCSNDDLTVDDRSGKKGPEPESVTTGTINGRTYAFIALERIGGVMVYDITDPANTFFVNYINSRDFSADVAADDSPEGLKFVPAAVSPTGTDLLLAACEVGGTVAVYELTSTLPQSYAITLEAGQGGTITASAETAQAGEVVTVTASCEPGYTLSTLTVTDAAGSSLTLTVGESSYAFSMPESAVTVKAVFEKRPLPFTDVKESDWYYESLEYAYWNGLILGTSESVFSPCEPTTRGMVAVVLYRLEGKPAANGSPFADVPSGTYYGDAIAWAAANGIVYGYGDGTYGPEDPVTREQLVTILYRYAGYKNVATADEADLSAFGDGREVSPYAAPAMSWAVAEGIVLGRDDGTLDPKAGAIRSEFVAVLVRFANRFSL